MSKTLYPVASALVLVAVAAWTLWMLGFLVYYGAFVIERPSNPQGAEAQIGALAGFLYAVPGLLVLSIVTRAKRRAIPRAVLLAPPAVLLAACAFLGYLRFLVSSASAQ